jgi:hypothetical protein
MSLPAAKPVIAKSTPELEKLELEMQTRFGVREEALWQYTKDLQLLMPLIEQHLDWNMKRMMGHRWEVRNGQKDKTYYGKTLAEAICRALLETK